MIWDPEEALGHNFHRKKCEDKRNPQNEGVFVGLFFKKGAMLLSVTPNKGLGIIFVL